MGKTVIKNTPQVSDIEVTFNGSGLNSYNGYCRRCGRVVTISMLINLNVTGIRLILASIPSEYAPAASHWLSCDYYGCTNGSEASIGSDGNIYVSATTSGNDFKISGTWITAS